MTPDTLFEVADADRRPLQVRRAPPRPGLTFYLGSHQPHWLGLTDIPMCISHRRLSRYKGRLPVARGDWMLDSGGFSELSMFGGWKTTPKDYVNAVIQYDDDIGNLRWAAPQDWMCEPDMLAETGLSVLEHQRRTVGNFVLLNAMWYDRSDADGPFMPVLQGWELEDYRRCWDMYGDAGVDLSEYEVVGVGSVCRREDTDEIGDIMTAVRELDSGVQLHGFGVKLGGISRYGHLLSSADSLAWSYGALFKPPLAGCAKHSHCQNCLTYAAQWYGQVAA